MKTGEHDKAIEELITAERINSAFANQSAEQKHRLETSFSKQREAYREGGINAYFENRLVDATQNASGNYGNATIYIYLGEKEKALNNLEKACQGRAFLSAFVKADPVFDSLRSEPRYQAILEKMGLDKLQTRIANQ